MNFGTKGCMYNCGDECTGECIKVETKTKKMSKEEKQITMDINELRLELLQRILNIQDESILEGIIKIIKAHEDK